MQFSTSYRNSSLTALVTALGTTGFLLIYTGSQPANCAAGATGTQLASLALSNPAGVVSGGVLTLSAITSGMALASGTAGYHRFCTDATGATCVAQGSVGTTGAELNFASGVIWTAGTTLVAISSYTFTAPGA
jgi:hypothetical protein